MAKRKKKRNVITAVGHFISWCVEISLFGILGSVATAGFHKLGHASWMLYTFMELVPSFNYVIFPCVQVRNN